jgi:hypothetical protein
MPPRIGLNCSDRIAEAGVSLRVRKRRNALAKLGCNVIAMGVGTLDRRQRVTVTVNGTQSSQQTPRKYHPSR